MATVGLLSVIRGSYKIFSITRLVTQPPRYIITHISLLNLRIDDFLPLNRLTLLSFVVSD